MSKTIKPVVYAFFNKKGDELRRATNFEREVLFRFANYSGLDLTIVENVNNIKANTEAFMFTKNPLKSGTGNWKKNLEAVREVLLSKIDFRPLFPEPLSCVKDDIERAVRNKVRAVEWHEEFQSGVRRYVGLRVVYENGRADDWATAWLSHVVYKRPLVVTSEPEAVWVA